MYQRKSFLKVKDSDIFYRYLNFKFYFSSVSRREIFIDRIEKYISEEETKFMNRYNIHLVDFAVVFAFSLYSKIEKRGFKVEELLDERTVKRTYEDIPYFTIYRYRWRKWLKIQLSSGAKKTKKF